MGIPEAVKVDEGVEEIPGCDLHFRKRRLCKDIVISPCELTGHSSSGSRVPLVGTPYLSQIQNLRTALHISYGRYIPYSEVFRLARVICSFAGSSSSESESEDDEYNRLLDLYDRSDMFRQKCKTSPTSEFPPPPPNSDHLAWVDMEPLEEPFLPMYKNLFEDLGVRLPFSDFEGEVLQFLQVTPSPLHPNDWSFIKCFQMLCEALDFPCTLDLFCHMFRPFPVVDKEDGNGKAWLALKTGLRGDMLVSNQARLLKKREKKAILVWGLRSAATDEFFKYSVKELSTLPEIKENMTKLTEKLRDYEVEMKAVMAKVKKLEEDHEKDG
ncbi:hypothetical protein SESBI_33356 [Sesbania bispinosa]|nr:hypothetical protein SESBI_33356 [Sesbania bispinosa]